MNVKEADRIEITSLMDNSIDFLSTNEKSEVKQFPDWLIERKGPDWLKRFRPPLAEHGFSLLVTVFSGADSHSVLFDTGISPDGVVTNADRLGVNLAEVEAIVLSHGHLDHAGGLVNVAKFINKQDLPIIVHEDMFRTRGTANPDGTVRKTPSFPAWDLVRPAKFVKTKEPTALAGDMILVTGEIPRKTDFEKGLLKQVAFVGGEWQPDPWVWDDRALVLNVKGKGLVVISGCAHAGIVNTVAFAQQISGVSRVYAVFGGFHLAGKDYETKIPPTVTELKKVNPKLVVPSHCTGWRGIYAIQKAMPDAFVWNSVGNLYQL